MSKSGDTIGSKFDKMTNSINAWAAKQKQKQAAKQAERESNWIYRQLIKNNQKNTDGSNTTRIELASSTPNTLYSLPPVDDNYTKSYRDAVFSYITVPDDERTITTKMGDDKGKNAISIPSWGVKDYINERTLFQKGTESLGGGIGYCYFKIFFDFNSEYGLLGGVIPGKTENDIYGINTAARYLYNIINSGRLSSSDTKVLQDKLDALKKFINILSYINKSAPWFFKEIAGVDDATAINLDDLTMEKNLDILCLADAIDMRLTALMDLYKFACYDMVNLKEVIPENLRKFNMQVVVFQVPLKGIHTQVGKYDAKSFNASDEGNRMSFKMVTFQNCEFNVKSTKNLPATMNNEKAFELNNTIHISYERAYEHNLNEWMKFYIGANTLIWDSTKSSFDDRLNSLYTAHYTKNNAQVIDISESIIHNLMGDIGNQNYLSGNYTNPVSGITQSGRGFVSKVTSKNVPYGKGLLNMIRTGLNNLPLGNDSYKHTTLYSYIPKEPKYNFIDGNDTPEMYSGRSQRYNFNILSEMDELDNKTHGFVSAVTKVGTKYGATINKLINDGVENILE